MHRAFRMHDRHSPFQPREDRADQDVRHGNPIALMILADHIERRDHDDPVAEHDFRICHSHG